MNCIPAHEFFSKSVLKYKFTV